MTLEPQHLDQLELLVWEVREMRPLRDANHILVHEWALQCWLSGKMDDNLVAYLKTLGYGSRSQR